jgi:hypothetical protein
LEALLAWGLDHAVDAGDPYRDRYRWASAERRTERTP